LGSIATEEDREVIRRVARDLSLAPACKIGVHHDLSIALAGGLLGQPGIVLIAGTGSSCYGQDGDGKTWQAGGWGPTIDDLGSGHWFGLQAMTAVVREHDRRQKPTILSARVLEALDLTDLPQIMRRVEIEGITRNEIALLAPLVTEAAESGDEVAQMILAEGVQELALLVATVCRELKLVEFLETVPVAVTGGLTKAGPVFFDALRSAVRQNCSACELVQPKCQPVFGALLKALELLGISLTTEIIDNLVMSRSVN
jgi:N-acetylglucosamine kinase-like BadF-type ATPase